MWGNLDCRDFFLLLFWSNRLDLPFWNDREWESDLLPNQIASIDNICPTESPRAQRPGLGKQECVRTRGPDYGLPAPSVLGTPAADVFFS
ncbi:hypothetical protein PG995_014233 [Apiospora arundinis]